MVWAVWHVPAFFYLRTNMRLGVGVIPGFIVGLTLGAILLTWLYNSTRGSVLAVAIWHALFHFFSATEATDGFNRRLSVSDIGLRGDVPLSPTRSASTSIQMSVSLRWTSAPVARTRPRFGLLGRVGLGW